LIEPLSVQKLVPPDVQIAVVFCGCDDIRAR
jgi:hypothetical protein